MKKNEQKTVRKNNVGLIVLIMLAAIISFILFFPFISIHGQRNVTIEVGQSYCDDGAEHLLGFEITTEGEVDTDTIGTYRIVYRSFLHRATRIVNVVDMIAPQLKLNGRAETYIPLNGVYEEKGVSAIDNYDGDISSSVVIEGDIDLLNCGRYLLRYTVSDSSGNTSVIERGINVMEDDFDYISSITNAQSVDEKTLKAITDVINDYASCMKYLQYTLDDALIHSDTQRYLYQRLVNMNVDMRTQMPLDLTYRDIECALQITYVRQKGDNIVVGIMETDTVVYNYNPSTQSISLIENEFEINSAGEVVDIMRVEGCFYALYKDYRSEQDYIATIDSATDSFYQQWLKNRQQALVALNELNEGTITYESVCSKSASVFYQADAAVAYANRYALECSSDYFYITDANCVNFVSQCLHSGGLPMVNDGDYVWKNYSYRLNNGNGRYGFSYSWVATSYFMRFMTDSQVNIFQTHLSPFLSEAGDVIMWGDNENVLGHATICSAVIRDENGKVIDILFCGNTNHVLNGSLMASTSLYCECEKVLGHN